MLKINFGPDPDPAGSPTNQPAPATPAPAPAPAAPKAATTVLEGKTEREIALENQLAARDKDLKDAQTKAAEAEDLAARLKSAQTGTPAPDKKKKKGGIRLTLLHPDPDDED